MSIIITQLSYHLGFLLIKIKIVFAGIKKLTKGEYEMKKILVPTDGSNNSKAALEKARELAELSGAEVTVLTVVKDLENHIYILENRAKTEIREMLKEQGNKILEEGLEVFEGFKEKVETVFIQGDPAEEIIKMVKEGDYDLVVMGSRGLNAISRVMLGSVSNRVLNHVETSILIVK